MSANRLMRLSITLTVTFLLALLAVLYFGWDADRTQYCIDKGNDPAACGWR